MKIDRLADIKYRQTDCNKKTKGLGVNHENFGETIAKSSGAKTRKLSRHLVVKKSTFLNLREGAPTKKIVVLSPVNRPPPPPVLIIGCFTSKSFEPECSEMDNCFRKSFFQDILHIFITQKNNKKIIVGRPIVIFLRTSLRSTL